MTGIDEPSSTPGLGAELRLVAEERARVLGSVAVDFVFLAGVMGINFLAARLAENLTVTGFEGQVVIAVQWLMGILTVGLVLLFVCRDFYVALRRALEGR